MLMLICVYSITYVKNPPWGSGLLLILLKSGRGLDSVLLRGISCET